MTPVLAVLPCTLQLSTSSPPVGCPPPACAAGSASAWPRKLAAFSTSAAAAPSSSNGLTRRMRKGLSDTRRFTGLGPLFCRLNPVLASVVSPHGSAALPESTLQLQLPHGWKFVSSAQ